MLVDEYQDTNTAQNALVLLLTKEHRNVCVVGDGDQCLLAGTPITMADGPETDPGDPVGDRSFGNRRVTRARQRYYVITGRNGRG